MVTGNNESFLKIIFVVSQDKMALKEGTNQFDSRLFSGVWEKKDL